jgi:hypothetical protein
MAEHVPRLGANIHAEPRIHGSILAINRDVRFSGTSRRTRPTWTCGSGRATAAVASGRATVCGCPRTRSPWAPGCTTSPRLAWRGTASR